MARVAHLESDEDLAWLFEVHLKNHPDAANNRLLFESAIVYGNEDWPDRIELFSAYGDPSNPLVIEPVYPTPDPPVPN